VTATAEPSLYDIPFRDAEGRQRTLGEFRGDVLLIVNTASY
jgi:glutathione peroxidase-family protein